MNNRVKIIKYLVDSTQGFYGVRVFAECMLYHDRYITNLYFRTVLSSSNVAVSVSDEVLASVVNMVMVMVMVYFSRDQSYTIK